MNEYKILTTMEVNEDEEGAVQIVFKIKGDKNKLTAF